MKTMTVADFIKMIEELAPPYLAEEWDNCGLQLGDTSLPVEKVMISLDVTKEVLEEAKEKGVSLLISHHPLFFEPLWSLDLKTLTGQLVKGALRDGINIYTAHTNLDNCAGGINDYLASLLGVKDAKPLKVTASQQLLKLVVFVPPSYLQVVRDAISSKGAGFLGNYSHCTFNLIGQGTFKPLEGSKPFLGSKGKLEEVEEVRLETIIPLEKKDRIIKAMEDAHPYEEVAYDLYPLKNRGFVLGPGRWGYLQEGLSLKSLLNKTKGIFNLDTITFYGEVDDLQRRIERVALCGGGGGDFLDEVLRKEVQVYITGDLKYHQIQRAIHHQLVLFSIGHQVTEKVGLRCLRDHLLKEGREKGYNFELLMAQETFLEERL